MVIGLLCTPEDSATTSVSLICLSPVLFILDRWPIRLLALFVVLAASTLSSISSATFRPGRGSGEGRRRAMEAVPCLMRAREGWSSRALLLPKDSARVWEQEQKDQI